jgi:hypothetical protein
MSIVYVPRIVYVHLRTNVSRFITKSELRSRLFGIYFPLSFPLLLQYTEKTKYNISQRNHSRKKDEMDHGGEIRSSDASS